MLTSLLEYFQKKMSKKRLMILSCYVFIGIVFIQFFSGKSRVDIEAITVSSDEQFIACFETGNGRRILCFRTDGTLSFMFDVSDDLSAGGECSLFFQGDLLCVQFYRTDKIMRLTMDGTVLDVVQHNAADAPPQFALFSRKNHQYVYNGHEVTVTYDKRSFVDYWFRGRDRHLAITISNKNTIVVWKSTAAAGPQICTLN